MILLWQTQQTQTVISKVKVGVKERFLASETGGVVVPLTGVENLRRRRGD